MPSTSTRAPLIDSATRMSAVAAIGAGSARRRLVEVHDLDHAQVVESADQREHDGDDRQPRIMPLQARRRAGACSTTSLA